MTVTPAPAQTFQPDRACPLDGLRVLDLSRLVAGNMLTLQLADFGAEVIKLEPDSGDPLRAWREGGVAAYWKVYGRNKKSIRLDLRSAEGKALLAQLIPTAHVLVESFRPGSMEAAGFGPEEVARLNPKLVFVRISGFGQTGPYAQRPGFGSLVEAMSGFASRNGFADKPPALPNFALADMVAGIQGAFATVVAVREAERAGGKGQVIDLSLLEPLHSTLGVGQERADDVDHLGVVVRVARRPGARLDAVYFHHDVEHAFDGGLIVRVVARVRGQVREQLRHGAAGVFARHRLQHDGAAHQHAVLGVRCRGQ